MGPGGGLKVKGQRLTLRRQRLQKERIGGWAEEPKGHAPSAPPAPPSPAAGSGAKRAEHRERAAWGGIPPRPGSRGAFAPPPLGPRAARPAPLREDGAALSGQCAGLRAWSAGGRWGLQAATPSSAPCPGTVGRRAQRSRLRSAAESALVGAAAAASRQVGARAEGRPSGPLAQPAVVACPGSLRPGRRELGSAARGLSLAGGGRAGRGAARPGARSFIGGASGQGAG